MATCTRLRRRSALTVAVPQPKNPNPRMVTDAPPLLTGRPGQELDSSGVRSDTSWIVARTGTGAEGCWQLPSGRSSKKVRYRIPVPRAAKRIEFKLRAGALAELGANADRKDVRWNPLAEQTRTVACAALHRIPQPHSAA